MWRKTKTLSVWRWGLVGGFVLAAAVALRLFVDEAKGLQGTVFDVPSTLLQARKQAIDIPRPRGWKQQQQLLVRCEDLLSSVYLQLATPAVRRNVTVPCLSFADDVLRGAPTVAIAHLIRAEVYALRNAEEQARAAYHTAQRFAPEEGWLAARRLRFALPLWGGLARAPDEQEALVKDQRLVLATDRYRPLLAQLYDQNPQARDWMIIHLEAAPARQKAQFLNDIRQRSRGL
ncbi:hypothetical protein [Thalassobius sp. Cn5-15]|uniref:hypothetical protein n=1 Tax=Thalassobius sp. Cn5-15 TaxID=2917763 RepID=UPI001EF3D0B1|nr:hypothetical protein [Thalassobius sp. Cn5-15]MCG7494018.1 hypothetical protein [Thalassobius sp. Cn5-15]